MDIDPLTVEHLKKANESLKLNNEALTKALDCSSATISQQDKIIANLQAKLVSQSPKLIRLKLDALNKLIKQFSTIYEEINCLLNEDVSQNIVNIISSTNENNTKENNIHEAIPNITNVNYSGLNELSQKSSVTEDLGPPEIRELDSTPLSSTPKNIASTKVPFVTASDLMAHDELMSLPASTSKAKPRLSKKKQPPSKTSVVMKQKIIERSAKQDNEMSNSDDDDDVPPTNKRRRIKVKIPMPTKPEKPNKSEKQKKKSKSETSPVINSKEQKNDTKEKKSSKETKDDSHTDIEVIDNTLPNPSTEKDLISSISASLNVPSDSESIKSSKTCPTSKRKNTKTNSKKKETLSKSKVKSELEVKAELESDSESKSVNGSTGRQKKIRRLSESSAERNNNEANNEIKPGPLSRKNSFLSYKLSELDNLDVIKNQPFVLLKDITLPPMNKDPIVLKCLDDYHKFIKCKTQTSSTNSVSNMNGDKNTSDSSDLIPLDLELECVEEEDVLILQQNHVSESDSSPEKTDTGHLLESITRFSPSPDFTLQNTNDEVSLDTIQQMLTKLCDDNNIKTLKSDGLITAHS